LRAERFNRGGTTFPPGRTEKLRHRQLDTKARLPLPAWQRFSGDRAPPNDGDLGQHRGFGHLRALLSDRRKELETAAVQATLSEIGAQIGPIVESLIARFDRVREHVDALSNAPAHEVPGLIAALLETGEEASALTKLVLTQVKKLPKHEAKRLPASRRSMIAELNRVKGQLDALAPADEGLAERGSLAGGVTHDTNNLLMIVLGYTELLEGQVDRELLGEIAKGAERARKMLAGFLAVTRGEGAEREPVAIGELVESAVRSVRVYARDAQVRLSAEIAPGLAPIAADAGALHRVITNLLKNAIEAGAKNVSATVAASADAIEIRVSDDGPGVDPKIMAGLFERIATTKSKGTGLGLVSSRKIIREHGGDLTVASAPGEGTTFAVRLPAR
jgi:signal transduction histidine kinase